MQPQQPPQNNYDFILNPAPAPKKAPLGGNSMATRILIVVGGLFVLALIAGLAIRLIGGGAGGGFNKAAMLSVAQDQTEIIRLSTGGTENSVSQSNKNFSVTAKLSMKSEQQTLLNYLESKGYKPDAKELLLKQNADTDKALADAKSSSTFDIAYTTTMQQALLTYQQDLNTAYKDANNETKAVLTSNYNASKLLLTQLTGKVAE